MAPFLAGGPEPTLNASFIFGSGSFADNPAVNVRRPTACSRRPPEPRWRVRPGVALAALWLVALAPLSAWSRDRHDHERARAAVEAGQALPLPTVLESLRRTHPGQVLELELEREGGRWIYEIKLLQADGRLLKLDVDAATAQVLQVRSRDEHKDERRRGREGGRDDRRDDGRPPASE